jgi:hypothetical protein
VTETLDLTVHIRFGDGPAEEGVPCVHHKTHAPEEDRERRPEEAIRTVITQIVISPALTTRKTIRCGMNPRRGIETSVPAGCPACAFRPYLDVESMPDTYRE